MAQNLTSEHQILCTAVCPKDVQLRINMQTSLVEEYTSAILKKQATISVL
jgi:hypothetical protein